MQKCTTCILEKTQKAKKITTLILGKNYPKVIYGIAIFEFCKALAKSKEMKGLFANLPPFQI